ALTVVLRSVTTPIGLGLVRMLAVQNLLTQIAAPALGRVGRLQKALPGPNAGSLAASAGTSENAPGVDEIVTSGQATALLAAYLVGLRPRGRRPPEPPRHPVAMAVAVGFEPTVGVDPHTLSR